MQSPGMQYALFISYLTANGQTQTVQLMGTASAFFQQDFDKALRPWVEVHGL